MTADPTPWFARTVGMSRADVAFAAEMMVFTLAEAVDQPTFDAALHTALTLLYGEGVAPVAEPVTAGKWLLAARRYDPEVDCSCPPPWGNDASPNPECVEHGVPMVPTQRGGA